MNTEDEEELKILLLLAEQATAVHANVPAERIPDEIDLLFCHPPDD